MGCLKLVLPILSGLAVVFVLLNNYYRGNSTAFKATSISRNEITRDIEERNRLVTKFCRKHRNDGLSKKTEFFSKSTKLYVDDKHKFIYCHMPKVASTAWLNVLLPLRNYHYKNFPHKASHLMTLAGCTREQAINRTRSYFKFLFVREPFERLLSAYKHMLKKHGNEYVRGFAPVKVSQFRHRNSSSKPVISFPEFLRFLASDSNASSSGLRSLDTWSSLVNVCKPCLMKYDFIGHYETLERDAHFVLKKIGADKLTTFPPWKPTNTSLEAARYYKQLSKEQQRSINELTKDDYEIFGYRKAVDSFR